LTSILPAIGSSFWSLARHDCKRSSKASPSATSLTFLSARSACPAAPVPRPPQPIRPTRNTSLPAAWTLRSTVREPASAPPTTAAVEVLRKARREADEELVVSVFLLMSCPLPKGKQSARAVGNLKELYQVACRLAPILSEPDASASATAPLADAS